MPSAAKYAILLAFCAAPLFAQAPPLAPASATQQPAPDVHHRPTLFLVGDFYSAQNLQSIFAPNLLHTVYSPADGQTSRSYLNSGAWDALLPQMEPGDFVLIEFNPDNTTEEDKSAARRTLEGDGDGTFDYLDPGTHKLELIHSYGWYLRKLVVDVINRGANPILCSAPNTLATQPHRDSTAVAENGKDSMAPDALRKAPAASIPKPYAPGAAPANSTFPDWAHSIATEQRIPFADLNQTTTDGKVTAPALRKALRLLKPDPLAPYLAQPAAD